MRLETLPLIILLLFLTAQFMIAGGIASFSIVSRKHEDKVFPRHTRGTRCPRLMHRNRLHLVLILIGLEIVLIVSSVVRLPGVLNSVIHFDQPGSTVPGAIPVFISSLVMFVALVAGIGAASRNSARIAFLVSYPAFPLFVIFRPLTGLFLRIISTVFPNLPGEMASLLFLLPDSGEHGDGFIEKNGSMLMHSIVEFGEKKTREVMVPRIDVFALDCHLEIEDIREKVIDAGHSRVPVYDNSIDRIIGILCVKDLVSIPDETDGSCIGDLLREAYFVPEGKKIDELLREFQMEKKHLAIVVDEYGGTSGIVTLEDILEEIVGEIRDEHDHEEPLIRETGDREYLVEGRINLDDLGELLEINLLSDQVDTLGGFLFDLVGKVPREGERIQYKGISFTVSRLDGQRIKEVLMRLPRGAKGDS